MEEQRLFLRKKVQTPLPIELLPGKEVWLDDLGEGGLSVSGCSPLELGTATFFRFQFPDANSVIEASGVVAWCGDSGRVGIRFTRIKADSSAALRRWLKSDLPALANTTAESVDSVGEAKPPRHRFDIEELTAEIDAAGLGDEAAFQLIAQRTLLLTRATGAAVALYDGHDVLCRASAGNAPGIGTKLNIQSTLTGECYRSGNIVTVANCENDPRVDLELCRELDFLSLLIVPVFSAGEIIGIAEVFSPIPGNFEGGDVLLLSSITELIAEIYVPKATR
jgi:hypothetical protein